MALNATNNTKIVISAEDKTRSAFASAQKNLEGLAGGFARFGSLAGLGAFGAVVGVLTKIATETANAQAEQAQLAAVLRSTGEAAGWSREQLNKMADDLSSKSTFAAGDITNAQTRLLSYTGIVGQQFPKAMQATIDMAARMGMSVEQSAETIGRALDIPSQGLTALTRQGFKFTGAQKELIKELDETGRTAEAQGIILKVLESSYDGAAEAARNTMGGAMKALRNSMDDLFEASDTGGSVFIRIINDMALAVDGLSAAMRGVPFDFMDKLLPNYQKFRAQMDKEFGPPAGQFNPQQKGQYLPRGAVIGGSAATLTDQINARAARFTEANKLTDAIAKQKEYSTKLAEINALEREGGLTAELAARYRAQLHAQTFKVKDATEKWTEAEEYHRNRIQVWIKEHDDLYKARVATMEAMQAQLRQIDDSIYAVHEESAAIERQIQVLQYGEAAVIRMEAARMMEAAAVAEQGLALAKLNGISAEHLEFTEIAIQKTRELAEARLQVATGMESKKAFEAERQRIEDSEKAQKESLKEMERAAQSTAESINRSITDALLRGFEDGKSFAENFKQTLINMFKTLVLQPIISFIVSPISGAISAALGGLGLSGNAFAGQGMLGGTGGLGSIFTQGKSLISAITDGFTGLNNSLTSAIGNLGTFLSTGNGGLGDMLGGMIGQYSSQIAGVLPYAGAALSLISGDVKGAAFQAAGAALGSAVGGPVGGMIGSALGSVVGGLFGGSGEKYKQVIQERYGTYANGRFSATQGQSVRSPEGSAAALDGVLKQFSINLGGLLDSFGFSSDMEVYGKNRIRRTSGRLATSFSAVFDGGSVDFEKQFGAKGDFAKGFEKYSKAVLGEVLVKAIQQSSLPANIRALFDGMTDADKVAQMINAAVTLGRANDALAARFGLTADAAAGVAIAAGYAGDELTAFVSKLAETGLSTQKASVGILKARDTLTEQLYSVYAASEKILPQTIDTFDQLLKSINTTTAAGQEMFANLFELRDAFMAYTAAIDGLKNGVNDAIYSMLSPSQKLAQDQADLAEMFGKLNLAVPTSIDQLIALGRSIDYGTEAGLDLAMAFPTLVQAFQQAQGGVTALAESLGLLNQNNFRNVVDFNRAQAYVRNGIPLSQLPSYDVGTSYVPRDGLAMIHQGERIIPAADNARLMQALNSNGNEALIAEIRALRQEVAALKRAADESARYNKRTSDTLQTVTRGGDSLYTEAA